jgi:hypothetical protein
MSIRKNYSGEYEFVIQGIRFRQNPKSPIQFAFVASANDLVKFCGVARKSEGLLSNYQRAIDLKRVKTEVTPFFRNPENCSPTAIVISLQDTNLCSLSFASGSDMGGPSTTTVFDTLTIRFRNTDDCGDAEIVALAKQFLDSRLGVDPSADISESIASDPQQLDDDDASEVAEVVEEDDGLGLGDEELADEESSEEEQEVEIGKSMLMELRRKLDNESALHEETISNLREMLKPALVIDGQHRLFGAAGVEEDLPVLVCSLVRPTWKEQVFQFVVVNDKAAGIPKPFITSLAGMSLTAIELDELRHRLTQAGLKLWEVEVMQRLGYDAKSPFFRKIEFKVSGGQTNGLGYQIMKKVGQAWYNARSAGLHKVMDALYRGPGDKPLPKKALRGLWQQNEDWFVFLTEFWGAFRSRFEGTKIWEVHSNLLTAVVIEMLQEDFFIHLNTAMDLTLDFEEGDSQRRRTLVLKAFKKATDLFVRHHKESHYSKEWKWKSLAHSDGRRALSNFFRKIREDGNVANDPIYTGQTK